MKLKIDSTLLFKKNLLFLKMIIKWLAIGLLGLLIGLSALTIRFLPWAVDSYQLFNYSLNNQPQKFTERLLKWQAKTNQFYQKLCPSFLTVCPLTPIKQFSYILPDLVGMDQSKTYLILLQNNGELRPSGGFIGSYAKIELAKGGLKDILVQDIYVPDGQIPGHVDPPWPIQQAFKQGWWRLRDSNWEPDFPTAAQQINWFFQKGGEEKTDGLIALNFLVLKDILKIIEPIYLPDYRLTLTADNCLTIVQTQVEKDFFPGSTQKKDFLETLSKQLILELKQANIFEQLQLIKVVGKNLVQKQILLYFDQPNLNEFFSHFNWQGRIKRSFSSRPGSIADYVYIVDTNLGANKANFYVKREVRQNVQILASQQLVKENLEVTYFNNSSGPRPKPPEFWGGTYENFLRVVLPQAAENVRIEINGQPLSTKTSLKTYQAQGIKSIGFFVEVLPLSQSQVEISYQQPLIMKNLSKVNYQLEIQKQPGIVSYPHTVKVQPGTFNKELNIKTDQVVQANVKIEK